MAQDYRIGHQERDEAIERLQEHLARGRLELGEFEDRMAKALAARTTSDLRVLFDDLPDSGWVDERQDAGAGASVPAVRRTSSGIVRRELSAPGSLLASWWVVVVGFVLYGVTRAWPLAVVAMVVYVVASVRQARADRLVIEYPAGDIEAEVRALLRAGRKVEAIKRWREEFPGTELATAKAQVDSIERMLPGPTL